MVGSRVKSVSIKRVVEESSHHGNQEAKKQVSSGRGRHPNSRRILRASPPTMFASQ